MENNKDLCKTCKHYWVDFPMPLEYAVSHCEILDAKNINQDMNEIVPYPCINCPFDKYKNNK